MSAVERDKKYEFLVNEAIRIGEHFDSVQILASNASPDGTMTYNVGWGNQHARYGMVKEYVVMREKQMREE